MVDNGQNDREASLFFNPSSYICVGTNMVRVDAPNTAKGRRSTNNCAGDEKSEDNAMEFGLLALFQTKEEEDDVEPKQQWRLMMFQPAA